MNRHFFFVVLIGLVIVSGAHNSAYALDPMRIGIRTDLPEKIKTIGQAAQYFADAIGYQLITRDPAPMESAAIASQLINPLTMTANVEPVEEAILGLLSPECHLIIDHEHKLFTFEKDGEPR